MVIMMKNLIPLRLTKGEKENIAILGFSAAIVPIVIIAAIFFTYFPQLANLIISDKVADRTLAFVLNLIIVIIGNVVSITAAFFFLASVDYCGNFNIRRAFAILITWVNDLLNWTQKLLVQAKF